MTRRHVDARAEIAHYVAGHAAGGTRFIAAYLVDAQSTDALVPGGARNANGIETRFEAIANGAAILATRRIERRKRIDRLAHCVATVDRTLFAVVRHIRRSLDRNRIAHRVALHGFAIAGGLASRQDGARGREGNTALIHYARARLAEGVGARAIRGCHASGALTSRITRLPPRPARGIDFRRIGNVGGHARRT